MDTARLAKALDGDDDAFVAQWFAHPHAVADAPELEELIAGFWPDALVSGRPRNLLIKELTSRRAWVCAGRHQGTSGVRPNVVTWLYSPLTQPSPASLAALPYARAFVFWDAANRAIVMSDNATLDTLLTSSTFCEFFSTDNQRLVLASMKRLVRALRAVGLINTLLAHGATYDESEFLDATASEPADLSRLRLLFASGAFTVGYQGVPGANAALTRELIALGVDFCDVTIGSSLGDMLLATPDALEVLYEEAFVDVDRGSDTILINAIAVAMFHRVPDLLVLIDKLFQFGVNVNFQDANGRTALSVAASHGYREVIDLLLVRGANANVQDRDGETVLFHMCDSPPYRPDMVKILLQHGADPHIRDIRGQTALHKTACVNRASNSIGVAKLLLQHGANANAGVDHGRTPLHIVVEAFVRAVDIPSVHSHGLMKTSRAIIQDMVNHGADFYQSDHAGVAPHDLVIASENPARCLRRLKVPVAGGC